MQLRIFLETTGQSWTLKPGREYLMGTSPDCDITLTPIDDSIAYIKFKFDQVGSFWHIENLQKADFVTLLNTQRLTRSIIQTQSQLKVVGQSIVLSPEMAVVQPQAYPQNNYPSTEQPIPSLNKFLQKAAGYAKKTSAGAEKIIDSAGDKYDKYIGNYTQNTQGKKLIQLSRSGISSPTDGAGIPLLTFSLATTFQIDRSEVSRICKRLYENVDKKINNGSLGKGRSRIVTYCLCENPKPEYKRDYILVSYTTHDEVRTTILIRFLESGDNLFLGIDTYVLGKTNRPPVYRRICLSLLLILISPWTIFLSLIPFFLMWEKVNNRLRYGESLRVALRQEFPGKIKFNAFDEDDILMFIKTTLHAALGSIEQIFQEEGLPIDSLDSFMKQVDVGSTTVVNNYGGSIDMRGAAVGAGSNAGYSKSVSK